MHLAIQPNYALLVIATETYSPQNVSGNGGIKQNFDNGPSRIAMDASCELLSDSMTHINVGRNGMVFSQT